MTRSSLPTALLRNANRTLSVLVLSRAAAARGDARLLACSTRALSNYDHADADLAELKEARAAVRPEKRAGLGETRPCVSVVP